jgi:NRPS condensation-like uncharacterized protein
VGAPVRQDVSVREPAGIPQRIPATNVDLVLYGCRSFAEMLIQLECSFDGHLESQLLERAGELLLDVEPMLSFTLVPDSPTPHWRRVTPSGRDLVTIARDEAEYEAERRTGLDATRGPQVALCLWPRDEGDRLLIRMTHVVGDGAALQLVAGRLGALYSALALDPSHRPGRGRVPTRDPARTLDSIPKLVRLRAMLDFAWFMAPRMLPRKSHRLRLPDESVGPWVPVIRRLPAPWLSSLSRYGKERGATVNDVFLAAAYRALAVSGWDETSALRITITVDLRRWCLPAAYATTVAHLSGWEYPYLMRDLGQSFDDTLARVSGVMRRRKESKPGLALTLVAHRLVNRRPATAARLEAGREPDSHQDPGLRHLSLSNEGLLDKSRLRFGEQTPVSAYVLPPFMTLPRLHLCLSGYDGALTLAAVTPQNGEAAVGAFLDTLLRELPADHVEATRADVEAPGVAELQVEARRTRLH